MMKEMIWKVFEKTGSPEAFMLYKELEVCDKIEEERFIIQDEVAISN